MREAQRPKRSRKNSTPANSGSRALVQSNNDVLFGRAYGIGARATTQDGDISIVSPNALNLNIRCRKWWQAQKDRLPIQPSDWPKGFRLVVQVSGGALARTSSVAPSIKDKSKHSGK
jgi:hypothetical protein